jgi:ParB family transcriptional regulator, chromosome partitioning protein
MTRKALGRGLNALLHEVETSAPAGLQELPTDLIDPNPLQPRRSFPEESLQELAASLAASGVVQPVLVRRSSRSGERYELIAGERRWRAARLAGILSIPAVVREFTDREALELALTENLLREDLNPLEIARAYEALQRQFQLSHEDIASKLGVKRSTVTNAIRLLRLTPRVQELIESGALSAGHARAILGLESAEVQERLAELAVEKGFSVREVETLVSQYGSEPAKKTPPRQPVPDANTRAAILEMERALGTRVRIRGNADRGKIEISYFSAEDLDRLYGRLTSFPAGSG